MIPASKLIPYDIQEVQNLQPSEIESEKNQNSESKEKQDSSKNATHYNRSYFPEDKINFRQNYIPRYDYRDDNFYSVPRQPSYISRQIDNIKSEIDKLAENNLHDHKRILGINKHHIPTHQFSLPAKEQSEYYQSIILFNKIS
mgnify:CR=1 FL=1